MRVSRAFFWSALAALVLTGCDCCMPLVGTCANSSGIPTAESVSQVGGIKLNWDRDKSDLDLFVITPDGDTAYADNLVVDSGKRSPDISDGNGWGPEWFSVMTAVPGNYVVKVNYHWHYGQIEDVIATVRVFRKGVPDPAFEFQHTFKQIEANSDSSSNPPNAWVVTSSLTFP